MTARLANAGARTRVALVTNIPAPYRVPVFNQLAENPDIDLHVFYAARREPDRQWDLPAIEYPHSFLRERYLKIGRNFIHFNPDLVSALRRFDPKVIVTSGFSPTYLLAFLFAKLGRRAHVAMTDGTLASEAGVTWVHRWLRRVVFRRSEAFVVASQGGRALLRNYAVREENVFFAPLCANTLVRWKTLAPASGLDFLFSSRLVGIKNPFFALQVAEGVALRLNRRISLAMLGSGPLQVELPRAAVSLAPHVDVDIAGHVSQADVPNWFARARIFLFPTSWDPWGVVANEACLAGLPTIVSPHAGAAGELICDGVNGYVRTLDVGQWVECASALLTDEVLHRRFSQAARRQVESYTPEHAAEGIRAAIARAVRRIEN